MENKKPNIILITFDSTRADRLGVAGYKKNITPFLDSIAQKGVYFSRAFATGPGSPHSFVAILTSTFPFDYGGFEYIDRPRVLISEVLKSNGYLTIAIHSAAYMSSFFGYDRGWDKFVYLSHFKKGKIMAGIKPGTWQTKIVRKIDTTRFWIQQHVSWAKSLFTFFEKAIFGIRKIVKDLTHYNPPFYIAEEVNEELKKILPQKPEHPLFLWIHYMDPHGPYGLFLRKSQNILNKIRFHLADLIGYFLGEFRFINKWFVPFHSSIYDASIKYTDKNIENLFKYLSSLDIINENSIVIICSDHGEEFLEHGWIGHDATLWNVNLNVPLIFYSEKRISSGKIVDHPVSLIDISPTILELANLPRENSFKGKNIFEKTNRPVIGQVPYTAADLSDQKFLGATIIHNGYKLINMLGKNKMLFSMENDFEEKINLYEKKKDIASQLEKIIKPYEFILPNK